MSLRRLCRLFGYLESLERANVSRVTSRTIAEVLRVSAPSVRKDISHLGGIGPSPTGYPVLELRDLLRLGLGLTRRPRACVVGLNWLGRGLLQAESDELGGVQIIAGFDSNINRLELTSARVELHPIFEIEEVAPRLGLSLALVADAGSRPEVTSTRLSHAGIKGILNFTHHPLGAGSDEITTIDVEILDELRRLAILTND